jgi:hypothetical protein
MVAVMWCESLGLFFQEKEWVILWGWLWSMYV